MVLHGTDPYEQRYSEGMSRWIAAAAAVRRSTTDVVTDGSCTDAEITSLTQWQEDAKMKIEAALDCSTYRCSTLVSAAPLRQPKNDCLVWRLRPGSALQPVRARSTHP